MKTSITPTNNQSSIVTGITQLNTSKSTIFNLKEVTDILNKSVRFRMLTLTILLIGTLNSYAQFAGGTGTSADPYQISNATQLQEIKNNLAAYYIQINDIDASETATWNSGSGFEPIGNSSNFFTGYFNGKGFKITGLSINRPSSNWVGLFGVQLSGTISNVALENVNIVGNERVGALIGNKNGTLENAYSTGTVSGNKQIGGLIGRNAGSTANCYSACVVGGTADVGGLVGSGTGTGIFDSYATGNVTGGNPVGGFIGSVSQSGQKITNCYATGNVVTVTNLASAGGFVGRIQAGTFIYCYATGTVTGGANTTLGGFVGQNEGIIEKSYSTGLVTGGAGCTVGGFVGHNDKGTILNSYSIGNVVQNSPSNSTGYAGGFAGRNNNKATITNTYSAGLVTSTGGTFGGFSGTNEVSAPDSGRVRGSYWNIETSGQNQGVPNNINNAKNTLVTGLSEVSMRQMNSFSGWDFIGIWEINEGTSYPYLRDPSVITSLSTNNDIAQSNISVYPNPASHYFTIDNIEYGSLIKITDVLGNMVFEEMSTSNRIKVDTRFTNNSIYIVQIKNNVGAIQTQKIVINQ